MQNWAGMLNLVVVKVGLRVVKTDMTCPFCIRCHVGIHLNAFVVFVKMEEGKSLVVLRLPPLRLVTKNGFWSSIL